MGQQKPFFHRAGRTAKQPTHDLVLNTRGDEPVLVPLSQSVAFHASGTWKVALKIDDHVYIHDGPFANCGEAGDFRNTAAASGVVLP